MHIKTASAKPTDWMARTHRPPDRRRTFVLLLIELLAASCLVANAAAANQEEDPNRSSITVSLGSQSESLEELFRRIESQTGYRVFFSRSKISLETRVTLTEGRITLDELLVLISEQAEVEFVVQNDRILVTPAVIDQSTDTASVDPVLELEPVTIMGNAVDPVGIIPQRPSSTLFGMERTVLETPRSVSLVEGEMIDRYSIRTIDQFIAVSPGTMTDNFFGVPGSMDIRGSSGDTFFRGFRRVENRGNFVTPITATSRVEIVRGPPTPLHGPGKVGGFLNFIPKTARSDSSRYLTKPTGSVTLTAGTYDVKLAEVELGGPLGESGRGGYYLYGQWEDSGSFYRRVDYTNELVQAAFNFDLSDVWRIEFGGMLQQTELPENEGWNRITQDLIDHGTYVTGHPTQVIADVNGNGRLDDAENISALRLDNFIFSPVPTFTPRPSTAFTPTGTTILSRRDVLTDTQSINNSENQTGYFDLIGTYSPNLEFKLQAFYDRMDLRAYNTTGFNALREPEAFEARVSLRHGFATDIGLSGTNIVGASYRTYDALTQGTTATNYTGFDRRDLSVGPTTQDRFGDAFLGERAYFNDDINGREETGLFLMTDLSLGGGFNLTGGVRFDSYNVDLTENSDTKVALGGGFAVVTEKGQRFSDSDDAVSYSASLSREWAMGDAWTVVPYFTYAESTALEVNQSGAFDVTQVAGGRWLADSDIIEGGVKAIGMEGRLYFAVAGYEQNRTRFDAQSLVDIGLNARGLEIEARYAPNEAWAFTFASTWQKTEETPGGLGVLQLLPPELFGLTPAETYGGRYRSLTARVGVGPTFESPGQPDAVLSLYGSHNRPLGAGTLSLTLGGTYAKEVTSGPLNYVTLPDYLLVTSSAFYTLDSWRFGVSVRNLFDERYFRTQAVFGDGLVMPGEGRTVEFSIGYSW